MDNIIDQIEFGLRAPLPIILHKKKERKRKKELFFLKFSIASC